MDEDIRQEDYERLARIRFEVRQFLRFSEDAALQAGLTAQQYQALLALRAAPDRTLRVGRFAEELLLKPHSATGLIDRLAALGHVTRTTASADRRQVQVTLTGHAETLLRSLAKAHRAELRRLRPLLVELVERL